MDTGKTDLSPARQKQFEELENEIYELKAELATHWKPITLPGKE